jgi:hypothetical protein
VHILDVLKLDKMQTYNDLTKKLEENQAALSRHIEKVNEQMKQERERYILSLPPEQQKKIKEEGEKGQEEKKQREKELKEQFQEEEEEKQTKKFEKIQNIIDNFSTIQKNLRNQLEKEKNLKFADNAKNISFQCEMHQFGVGWFIPRIYVTLQKIGSSKQETNEQKYIFLLPFLNYQEIDYLIDHKELDENASRQPHPYENQVRIIVEGWLPILLFRQHLTGWVSDNESFFISKNTNSWGNKIKMKWLAQKFFIQSLKMSYYYDRKFEIESWIEEGNQIRFSIKTDKDLNTFNFDLSDINNLVLHIKQHFETRFSLSTQYNHQLRRVDALLETLGKQYPTQPRRVTVWRGEAATILCTVPASAQSHGTQTRAEGKMDYRQECRNEK